jgi:hypothetical protein
MRYVADVDAVVAVLRRALEALELAEVPESLQPVAYRQAIEMVWHDSRPTQAAEKRTAELPPSDANLSGQVARHFGVAAEMLDYVYDVRGDNMPLVVHRSKLPQQKSPAMKAIALLVVAGRQAAAMEEWTTVGVIRDVCRDFGVLDTANFATQVGSLGDTFLVRGTGQSREFKMTRHGYEEAGRLVAQLGGN